MNSRADHYLEWDAAYVLGALSPAERLEFEEHLSGCAECQTAVSELAGMPGLLAQVPASDVLPQPPAIPPAPANAPPPATVAQLGTPGSARRWAVVAAGVAAAFILGALGGFLARGFLDPNPPAVTPVSGPVRVAFAQVIPTSITAVVDIVPDGASTMVQVECQYGGAAQIKGDYGVYVVDRMGRSTEVKTWTVRPNRVMRPSGTSELQLSDIAAVEIRFVPNGLTLLRAQVH
jgi:hypothetical protein